MPNGSRACSVCGTSRWLARSPDASAALGVAANAAQADPVHRPAIVKLVVAEPESAALRAAARARSAVLSREAAVTATTGCTRHSPRGVWVSS